MSTHILRPAIAMIELIFALVIMGIVLMSAPQLISQAQTSTYVSLQQEAIAAGASHMSFILSRHWDENNTNQNPRATILLTDTDKSASPIGLENNIFGFRAGTPKVGTKHRMFLTGGSPLPTDITQVLGRDLPNDIVGGNLVSDDIDDFDGSTTSLTLAGVTGTDDYIDQNFVMTTRVRYITDNPSNADSYATNTNKLTYNIDFPPSEITNSTSIKWVKVTLQDDGTHTELDKNITLNAFSCNIGGYELEDINL